MPDLQNTPHSSPFCEYLWDTALYYEIGTAVEWPIKEILQNVMYQHEFSPFSFVIEDVIMDSPRRFCETI